MMSAPLTGVGLEFVGWVEAVDLTAVVLVSGVFIVPKSFLDEDRAGPKYAKGIVPKGWYVRGG